MIGFIRYEKLLMLKVNSFVKTIAKVLVSGQYSLIKMSTILTPPVLLLSVILLCVLVMHGMGNGVLTDNFLMHLKLIFLDTNVPIITR